MLSIYKIIQIRPALFAGCIIKIIRQRSTMEKLFTTLEKAPEQASNKITVVGVGQVGMACAMAVIMQDLSRHVCLIDDNAKKLEGEMLDLQHGSSFLRNAKIESGTDYEVTAGSKLCIITAGARQKVGESRLSLVQRNTEIMKDVIPKLVEHSPDTILHVVTNPVDILTHVAWKLSGLPKTRVIGSGTHLDSSRFRYFLSQKLGLAPTSVHGYIIGEHGDTSVPVWSEVNVSGIRLCEINPDIGTDKDTECWGNVHKEVVDAAYKVINLKGYTSWSIGLSVSDVCAPIVRNTRTVKVVSVPVKGIHGIEHDVCLSLPAVLAENGVCQIVRQHLSDDEKEKLQQSAKIIDKLQKDLNY